MAARPGVKSPKFGLLTLIDDSGDVQIVQLTQDAVGSQQQIVTDKTARMGDFGFASAPPIGSRAIAVQRPDSPGPPIVLASIHSPSRPRSLEPGDTVVYDVRGRMIRLTAGGIEIDAAGAEVLVSNAAKVRCTCDVETTGDIVSRADGARVSLNALHDAYNQHTHPATTAGGMWGSGPPVPLADGEPD